MPDVTIDFIRLEPPERRRVYHFPDGEFVAENVVAICVRPSGTHRLETADGKKIIVSSGWMAITLDVNKWTF